MLKDILTQHNIGAGELGRAIVQQGGRRAGMPLSAAAISRLINHNEFPAATPRTEVIRQANDFLTGRGVPADVLEKAWTTGEAVVHLSAAEAASSPPEDKTMLPDAQVLSREAKAAFRLRFNPFEGLPQADDDYFLTEAMRSALEAFHEAGQLRVLRAVIGESGSGKTSLKRLFRKRMAESLNIIEVLVTCMSDNESRGGRIMPSTQIHSAIIRHFGGDDARIPSDADARQRLSRRLLQSAADGGKGSALIVDEAHDLGASTLAHLKRFHELADGALGIVLLGQPALKAKLTPRLSPDIKEAGQRFPTEFLPPLETDEIAGYLDARLQRAGQSWTAVFGDDAPAAIAEHLTRRVQEGRGAAVVLSESYPLAINNLVVRALNLCARSTGGAETVSAGWIAAAAKEV
jgi:type II secretory pathway predicted ATPase ExeA